MHPPIAATLALIELSLHPLSEALRRVKSYNGAVVFMRDRHHTDQAGVIASHAPRLSARRLEFVRSAIEHRSVDLTSTTLGETLRTKHSALLPSRLCRQHLVWGAYVALPGQQEAVVQLAFDKTAGAVPSIATIENAWQTHKDEIIVHLQTMAALALPSVINACKLDVPVTPNAFVLKWDIMDSSHVARHDYGELRHFITTFESTLLPVVNYHGGQITAYAGDAQTIIVPIPPSVDRTATKALRTYVSSTVAPLIDKLQTIHATIAPSYDPVMRLRLGVGMGWVETSQLGEVTGPILWSIGSKMKMRASSSELFTLCLDDSVRSILA